jgi:hypothetical protein
LKHLWAKIIEAKFLSTLIILAPFTQAKKRSVILLSTEIQRDQIKRQYSNNKHTLINVGSLSKKEPYFEFLLSFFILLTREFYINNSANRRKNFYSQSHFTVLDKTKSSETLNKKVRWITPSNVCEQTVDSSSVESESDMTLEEELYEENGTKPSSQKCAPSQSCYTECASGQVTHSPCTQCF